MKTLLIKHWKTIVIGVLLNLIGVILANTCRRQPATSHTISIDSLQNANVATQQRYNELSDSVNQVILEKDKTALELTKSLNSITAKYRILINREPSHDTVVQTHEVFIGNECIEKLPIIQAQLDNCESKVDNYKQLVMVKTTQNIALQSDFNRALSISRDQEKDLKKLNRKNKWLKVGMVGSSVLLLSGAVFVLAQ